MEMNSSRSTFGIENYNQSVVRLFGRIKLLRPAKVRRRVGYAFKYDHDSFLTKGDLGKPGTEQHSLFSYDTKGAEKWK